MEHSTLPAAPSHSQSPWARAIQIYESQSSKPDSQKDNSSPWSQAIALHKAEHQDCLSPPASSDTFSDTSEESHHSGDYEPSVHEVPQANPQLEEANDVQHRIGMHIYLCCWH